MCTHKVHRTKFLIIFLLITTDCHFQVTGKCSFRPGYPAHARIVITPSKAKFSTRAAFSVQEKNVLPAKARGETPPVQWQAVQHFRKLAAAAKRIKRDSDRFAKVWVDSSPAESHTYFLGSACGKIGFWTCEINGWI